MVSHIWPTWPGIQLKQGLSIGTTFDPCSFSLDNTFNATFFTILQELLFWLYIYSANDSVSIFPHTYFLRYQIFFKEP
jgi:hypothetical protein